MSLDPTSSASSESVQSDPNMTGDQVYALLAEDIDETSEAVFTAAVRDRIEQVFDLIFALEERGEMAWHRVMVRGRSTELRGQVEPAGRSVAVPVRLFTSHGDYGRGDYLVLGSDDSGPTRNEADERVAALVKKYQ